MVGPNNLKTSWILSHLNGPLKFKSDHNHTCAQKPPVTCHLTHRKIQYLIRPPRWGSLTLLGCISSSVLIDYSILSILASLLPLASECCPELLSVRCLCRLFLLRVVSVASWLFLSITSLRSWLKWQTLLKKDYKRTPASLCLLTLIHFLLLSTYHLFIHSPLFHWKCRLRKSRDLELFIPSYMPRWE